MTDTTERVDAPDSDTTMSTNSTGSTGSTGSTVRTARSSRTGIAAMNVAELKRLASGLGIAGTTKMRKDDLLAAIGAHQSAPPSGSSRPAPAETAPESGPTTSSEASSRETSLETSPQTARETTADRSSDGPRETGAAAPRQRVTAPAGAPTVSRESAPVAPAAAVAAETAETTPPTQSTERAESRRVSTTGDERDRLRFDRPDRTDRQQAPATSRMDRADRQDRIDRTERQGTTDQRSASRQAPQAAQNGQPAQNGQATQQTGQQTGQQSGQQSGQHAQSQRTAPATQAHTQPSNQQQSTPANQQPSTQQDDGDDDGRGSRRRSRQRSRDRKRGRTTTTGTQEYEPELQINDDDVLVPVAGILDVLDSYAFVRTSGYLAGPNDVYVPLGLVKKYGLRKGDAVTGSIKAPRDGEQPQSTPGSRQKFNALVRLDTINGTQPDLTRTRVEFSKLTPLYPQERLRLETEVGQLTTRVIDLVAPIGKGQRGLIVAPAKAGKTMVMQAIANAVTANNPECHLMVVLVDERPEEVTEMQRAVKGEVIASTFDRPAEDHTSVAELAIERAKRLVELGHDVVVLLDSITKLGRAYNLSAPASGRILSGGVDSAALYPPKKFFGAARNIENGGSLTIIATALVDTGSRMDEVIFEEFKGTGNMELKLSRELANRRLFPAVDVNGSGTRREEILLGPEELKIMWKLRRVLGGLEPQQSLELLLDRLKRTRTNIEFLRQVQMSTGSKLDAD